MTTESADQIKERIKRLRDRYREALAEVSRAEAASAQLHRLIEAAKKELAEAESGPPPKFTEDQYVFDRGTQSWHRLRETGNVPRYACCGEAADPVVHTMRATLPEWQDLCEGVA